MNVPSIGHPLEFNSTSTCKPLLTKPEESRSETIRPSEEKTASEPSKMERPKVVYDQSAQFN